jgi:molybdopterin/thiamine biosynthesis adenylyltransferase
METWYTSNERRYNQELQALEKAGIEYTEDKELKAQNILCLQLKIEKGNPIIEGLDDDLELKVVFPDLYPFFRPEVSALNLALPRHQNPIQKNLCLLPRTTSAWRPEDTLADLLISQLSAVLSKGQITSYEELSKDETEQAEPISEYYPVGNNIIFDTSPYEVEIPTGALEQVGKFTYGIPNKEKAGFFRLAVLKSFDNDGNELSSLPDTISNLFNEHTGKGVVCRVNEAPPLNPEEFIQWLKGHGASRILDATRSVNLGSVLIEYLIAINFPEEIEAGRNGSGWLFYIKYKKGGKHFPFYAKALRANRSAFSQRVPKLKPLHNKKIALIGLGALGGPCAIEFARNGIEEVRIIDYDFVDPPTTIRWPLGMEVAGQLKTVSIKNFIETNYPYTKVTSLNLRIGGSSLLEGASIPSAESLDKSLDGVSLIFDASAEIGVMNYLSLEAKKRNTPYVAIEATEGALGGQVLRINPRSTKGCWMCLQYAQCSGLISIPPKDDSGTVQAAGCGDLTFTGTSFDLQNICAAGVRLAISTLCEEDSQGYPLLDWDVSILSLVDETGKATSPQWKDYKLDIHPECPYCANKK